jgi:hypothetical protein
VHPHPATRVAAPAALPNMREGITTVHRTPLTLTLLALGLLALLVLLR